MSETLILIIFGSFLMLAAAGLAYTLRPSIKIAGQEIKLAGEAKSGPFAGALAFGVFLFGAVLVIVGVAFMIEDRGEARAVRVDEREEARLARDEIQEVMESAAVAAPTSEPIPSETPGSAVAPAPADSNVALDLVDQALEADAAGDIERAIRLYAEAIQEGLSEDRERLALLEIGFLELLFDDGCENAASALADARSVPTSAHENLILQLDEEVAFVCGT